MRGNDDRPTMIVMCEVIGECSFDISICNLKIALRL